LTAYPRKMFIFERTAAAGLSVILARRNCRPPARL
jgi:hypothetical protein